jgi:choline kinase
MIDRLVILAAGGGTRLRQSVVTTPPKPLTKVAGVPMISRVLLGARAAGVRRVDVVVGFRAEELRAALSGPLALDGLSLRFFDNPLWDTTANGVSLLCAASDRSPFYLSMSDHLFDDAMWTVAQRATPPEDGAALLIDRKISACFDIDDATKVKTQGSQIVAISKTLTDYDALDCGLFAVTAGAFDALAAERDARGDCSLSDGMRRLGARGAFVGVDVGAAFWHDVDTPEALAFAERYLARTHSQASSYAG